MRQTITAAALAAVLATSLTGTAFAGGSKEMKAAIAACKKDHKGDKAATKSCIKDAKSAKAEPQAK